MSTSTGYSSNFHSLCGEINSFICKVIFVNSLQCSWNILLNKWRMDRSVCECGSQGVCKRVCKCVKGMCVSQGVCKHVCECVKQGMCKCACEQGCVSARGVQVCEPRGA